MTTDERRFFRCEDNGEHYDFVARDLEHAKQILKDSGMETIADVDKEFGTRQVEWRELAYEQAALVNCSVSEDDNAARLARRTATGTLRIPLSECELGEWFSTCV